MKNKQTISKLLATAAIALAFISNGFAQVNLGADCGCPPVASRPSTNLSTIAVSGGANDGNLTAKNTILDCAHKWVLDKKIYVPNGSTLTIQPGTVIFGNVVVQPNSTALVVSRGGKIIASGTPTCQIVFTVTGDNLDGTFPINNLTSNKWGGLVIAGQASNNLTLAKNGPFQQGVGDGKICVADGLGTFEGFATSDFRDQFGVNLTTPQTGYNTTFDDNDNSGILRYVSIRNAGAVLQVGGEINALSLGSVGRGTTIDHVDIVSSADDGMEFWGGTVNIKYVNFMFGNDDMFDWDDGYSGHAQFIFGIKSSSADTANAATKDADNGFECDADDQASGNGSGVAIGTIAAGGYRSHPVIYNATMIGHNKRQETSDNTGMAAINAKELTEGEIYNSVFANFAIGLNVWSGNLPGEGTRVATQSSSGATVTDSYDNWRNNNGTPTLIVKCNTFAGIGTGVPGADHATFVKDVSKSSGSNSYYINPTSHYVSSTDSTQFYVTDMNTSVSSIPGMTYLWTMDGSNNTVSAQYNATPSPALSISGCPVPAVTDPFLVQANYRGAFQPGVQSWLSGWSYSTLLQTTAGLQPCPTDINGNGVTNNADFLLLLGQFGQSCH